MNEIIIHTDGGSRGNPGPAGIGAVVEYGSKKKGYSEFIGEKRTNNEAEYEALIMALKKAKSLVGKKVAKGLALKCFADSELMVKQLNHEYKIQNEGIKPLFFEIWNLMLDFKKVEVSHIRREENKEADKLANEAMDKEGVGLGF
jgi:ribonuclease HI